MMHNEQGNRRANRLRIRTRKEDSAFLYTVLEAHEGLAAYSTLPHQPGDPHRDLELLYSSEREPEVRRLLVQLGDLVYELKDET